MKRSLLFLLSLALIVLGGCEASTGRLAQQPKEPTYKDAAKTELIKTNYAATDKLLKSLKRPLDPSLPLVVATLVNIDELTESSRLGRLVSEQIGARLSAHNYQVVELKLRGDIFVKQTEGELLLSREVKNIMLNHKAQAVVVGTYSEAKNFLYLNIKIVSVLDNTIIGAHDYVLPIDKNIRHLLLPHYK
ncbi:FlgO family outer membrane protein [Desulfovibrionales bacterium]